MVENQVLRSRSDPSRNQVRRGCRKSPGRREFGGKEHCAVEFHSAQDLGEGIHAVIWTPGKVPRPPSKGISVRKPLEQVIGTLGHCCASRGIVALSSEGDPRWAVGGKSE